MSQTEPPATGEPAAFAAILDDLAFVEEWDERYRYLIDLGRKLAPLTPEEYSDATKVRGCASQVWLVTERSGGDGRLALRGDSDALIVKGLIALVIALFSGRTAREILATDAEAAFARLQLREHLTAQRSNGLASMLQRIRDEATRAGGGTSAYADLALRESN